MHRLQGRGFDVQPGQKIDGAELAVNGRRPADGCAQRQIGRQQAGDAGRRGCQFAQWAGKRRVRQSPPGRRRAVRCQQAPGGGAHRRVLRCQRAAADQVARTPVAGTGGNAFPQQVEHGKTAVLLVDAGPAQLKDLAALGFKRAEVEFTRAVVAQRLTGAVARLQPVGAHHQAVTVLHHQVLALRIKGVGVQPGVVALRQALVQLQVEHLEAQRLHGVQVGGALGQPQAVCGLGLRGGLRRLAGSGWGRLHARQSAARRSAYKQSC